MFIITEYIDDGSNGICRPIGVYDDISNAINDLQNHLQNYEIINEYFCQTCNQRYSLCTMNSNGIYVDFDIWKINTNKLYYMCDTKLNGKNIQCC